MDWRCKAALQSALSLMPGGEQLHYLLQRWVTRSVTPSEAAFQSHIASAHRHLEQLRRCGHDIAGASFFEFGAGWNLAGPLYFYASGVGSEIVADVRPLARRELVSDAMARLRQPDTQRLVLRTPPAMPRVADWVSFLRTCLHIDYRAPCDARNTGLPSESVDCITSTATMEHVPPDDVALILAECHRLLRPGGVMSHYIDYKDHYAQFDRRITAYNFLQYSDRAWRRYSPALHYQNRLRHSDYLRLVERAGFDILDVEPARASDAQVEQLRAIPLAERFRRYELPDLAVRDALIGARKRTVT